MGEVPEVVPFSALVRGESLGDEVRISGGVNQRGRGGR